MGKFAVENFMSMLQMIERREILNNQLQYLKETHDLQNIPWFYTQTADRESTSLKLWNRYDMTICVIEYRLETLLLEINQFLDTSILDPKGEMVLIPIVMIERTLSEIAAMIEFIKRCFIQRMESQYQPPFQIPIFKIECIPGMYNLYKACDNISDNFMYLLDVEFRHVFKPLILVGGTRKIDIFPRERIIRLDEDFKFRSRFLLDIAHEISHLKIYEIIGDMRRICYNLVKEEIVEQILEAIINDMELVEEIAENLGEKELIEEISKWRSKEHPKNEDLKFFEEKMREEVGRRINLLFEKDPQHFHSIIETRREHDEKTLKRMEATFEENEAKFPVKKRKKFRDELKRKKEECSKKKKLVQKEREKFRHFIVIILNYFYLFEKKDIKNVAKITDFVIYVLFDLLPVIKVYKEEFRLKKVHLVDLLCEFLSFLVGMGSYVICASSYLDDEENKKLYQRLLGLAEGDRVHSDIATEFFKNFYVFVRDCYPSVIRNLLGNKRKQNCPKNLPKFLEKRRVILMIEDDMEDELASDNFEINAKRFLNRLKGCNPDKILYNFWIIHQKRCKKLAKGDLSAIQKVYGEYKSSHLFTMEIVNMLSRGDYSD